MLANRLSIIECKLKCLHCKTVSKFTSSPCCWESKSIVNNYHVHMMYTNNTSKSMSMNHWLIVASYPGSSKPGYEARLIVYSLRSFFVM